MKEAIFIIIFLQIILSCQAQIIYYSTIESSPTNDHRVVIGTFNLNTCQAEEIYEDFNSGFNGYVEWIDIAVCPDGNLYGLGNDGIYSIDLVNKTHSLILDDQSPLPGLRWRAGLACTKDTILIYGERDILTYNLNSEELIYHGRVPTPMTIWGNIFWLNGQLMSSANDQIIQLDLQDPMNSQVYCNLPTSGFLSLIQVPVSCDSIAIFAYHISGDIFLVNPVDCSTTFYCTIPHVLGQTFQGSSPLLMFMPPDPCMIRLDLDSEDETLQGVDYQDTLYCSLPGKFIFSNPDLYSDKSWDSLTIWIEVGYPGIFLDGNSPSFATLTGQQTNRLKFYSDSISDFSSLSPFINQLILTGSIPNGVSALKIGFCGWAKNLVSDTAYAYITLIGRATSAGNDNSTKLCISDPILNLQNLLSPSATSGGLWIPSLLQNNFFDPKNDKPGKYQYVVDDPICNEDTADFLIETISQPIFDLGPNRFLCPGDTTRFSINLSNVDFLWSDGSSQSSIDIIEPQILSIDITDQFGCIYLDSTQVEFDENCIIQDFYIPNIFSPDGNGINDEWIIDSNAGIQEMEVSVFDRWGNMLFYQNGDSIHWNGISKNNELIQSGVYVYMLKIFISSENKIIKTGSITLLR